MHNLEGAFSSLEENGRWSELVVRKSGETVETAPQAVT